VRIIWTIFLCTFAYGCEPSNESLCASFESMGTRVHVEPSRAARIVERIFSKIDEEMSEWKASSVLSRVNQAAGVTPIECSEELIAVVQQALDISSLTKGAFDPTWASMWELWDFDSPSLPDEQEISKRLPMVDWERVKVTENTIFLTDEGMALGLGGIAKGVALNKVRNAMIEEGIEDFMIVVGGQVLVGGAARTVGIRKPDGLPNELIGTIEIKDTSASTSGDYEKYFERDGVRYHHIIDPRTGYPSKGTRSVTVIAHDAALADALSTALCVMGADQGLLLVNQLAGVEALFINENGVLLKSEGFHLHEI